MLKTLLGLPRGLWLCQESPRLGEIPWWCLLWMTLYIFLPLHWPRMSLPLYQHQYNPTPKVGRWGWAQCILVHLCVFSGLLTAMWNPWLLRQADDPRWGENYKSLQEYPVWPSSALPRTPACEGKGTGHFYLLFFFALFIALKHMSAIASIVLLILFSEQAYFYLLRASTVFDLCNTNPLANMKTGLLPFASWQRCIQFKWHINEPCMKLCILACTTNKPYSYVHCDVLLREVVNAPFLICCHDI